MRIVQHHIKYKEVHGFDEVVLMEHGEHHALHDRLRKEGKCNIPITDLAKISRKARSQCKAFREYQNKISPRLQFNERLGLNTRLQETIMYNKNTGRVTYCSMFIANNGFRLPILEV